MPLPGRGFETSYSVTHLEHADFPVAGPAELPADVYPADTVRQLNATFNQLTRIEVRELVGRRLIEVPDELRGQLDPMIRQLHRARWRSHAEYSDLVGKVYVLLGTYLRDTLAVGTEATLQHTHLIAVNQGGLRRS